MRGERLSQRVSAVTPLGEALDGTPVKKRRAAAKSAPKPAVSTGVLCSCDQRFEDFREAYIHVRLGECPALTNLGALRKADGSRFIAECGTWSGFNRHRRRNEQPCEPCTAAAREREKERGKRPERREYMREYMREYGRKRWQSDAAFRERRAERHRERHQEMRRDPVRLERYREQERERARRRRADPAYRERRRQYQQEWRARKKAEQEATNQREGIA